MDFKDLPLLGVGNTRHLSGVPYSGEGQNLLCLFPNEGIDLLPEQVVGIARDKLA